jgi:hypothetical protein
VSRRKSVKRQVIEEDEESYDLKDALSDMSAYTSSSDESKTNKKKPKGPVKKSINAVNKTPPPKRSQA